MISLLHDISVFHNKNQIRITDRRQTVCDHKARSSLHQIIHRFLNQYFCSCIDRACRLIQDQDLWICKDCTCNRQKLLLSLGNVACFFVQFHIISTWKCLYKSMHMCCLCSLDHFFICSIQFTITDIFTDGAMEQPCILKHHSEHFS